MSHMSKSINHRHPFRWSDVGITFVFGVAVGIVAFAFLMVYTAPANAAPDPTYSSSWRQPYGGCDEAWQAPHSTGADECRAHGWTVKWWIIVSPKDRVRYVDPSINQCANEDAGRFCTWNFSVPRRDGLDLWYGGAGHRHYVKQVTR